MRVIFKDVGFLSKSVRRGHNFLRGAAILTTSTVIVKAIGFFFKIPLTNLTDTSVMGYFNTSYNIFNFMYVIASAGLPSAIAKLVSSNLALGRHRDADRVIKIAFTTYSVVALVGFILVFTGAEFFAGLLSNAKATYAIMSISPAIFLITIVATFKGYFQGHQNMVPTATSNIIEALTQMILGLGSAYILQSLGYPYHIVAAGAVSGVSVGALLSTIYMYTVYKRARHVRPLKFSDKTLKATPTKQLYKEFLKIAIPITLGSVTQNLTGFIDVIFVMRRLNSLPNVTQEIANSLYGTYTSMAVTLFNMPPSVIMSLGISALPAVSAAFALKNKDRVNRIINSTLRICAMFAFPSAIGMSVMSKPIVSLIFFSDNVKKDIGTGAGLLSILSVAIIFVSISQITQYMLQAIGKPQLPVRNIVIGGILKIVINYILVGTPGIGIYGAPIGTNVCYFVIMILNLISLKQNSKVRLNISKVFIKPFIASVGSAAAAYLTWMLLFDIAGNTVATLCGIAMAVIIYAVLLLFTRTLSKDDINLLPFSQKLLNTLEKKGWIS